MSVYQGLVNEGSTCYLNSLLQTLYMTSEFRQNVYHYQHDPKKISEKDSIPYQLQKIFVNLQTRDKPSYTKDLLRSFQWNDNESFQQHDVQQFCRKLFEAIEKTHKNTGWIKELFQGSTISYVDCGKHRSTRSQMFMDIALPIRNQYTRQTYQSIEESLCDYLRPQKLQDKFECDGCGQKVFVQKGMALQSLPPILTLQLNRFQLNFQTFQREKINSFFYFPQILEMHRFMKPHSQIQVKQLPANLVAKSVTVAKAASPRTVNFGDLAVGKIKQRKKSDDKIGTKESVTFLDEENKDKRTKQLKQFSKQDQKMKNLQILALLKSQKGKFDKKMQKIKQKQQIDFDNDVLFGMGPGFITSQDWQNTKQKTSDKPNFQKADTNYQHQEEAFDPTKQYPDLTYALYAVLVHSGGSYGGHYYAYISDGQNWYKFNDSTVTKVSRFQMRKYGVNTSSDHGTNAYLLFYKDVKTFKQLKNIQIPVELYQKVKIEEQKAQEVRQVASLDKQKRFIQLNQSLIVKVFKDQTAQAFIITVVNKNEETVKSLRQKIKEHYAITQKDENWRLRRYNKTDDSLHEVYQLSETTLQQLGLKQQIYLTIEVKTDDQVFQDYNPRKITVKINIWKPDIIMVVEKKLKPIKINILDEDTFEQLYTAIVKSSGISDPLVIKRNFSGVNPITILQLQSNKSKKLIDLRFFNNLVLYVQERGESLIPKWAVQFDNERYRCMIKFNHPKHGQAKDEQIYFDTRRTLGQLKAHLSTLIDIPQDNFRVKKGRQTLAQMTTYKKKLIDLRFIGNEYLFLQEGKSSKGSVIVKRGEVGLVDDRIQFNIFQQLQFEIGNDLVTISDLCKKISEKSGIPQQNIRIRQYKSVEFKQIFSPSEQIQRIREKSLVWQLIQGDIPKGLQIYYRVFSLMTFEFGPLKNLYADTSSSYQELSLLIQQETGIPHNKILAWKPLSNYIQKENMLDVEWSEIRYVSATIREQPLMINCDGDILIIKEAETVYNPPKIKKVAEGVKKNKGGEAQLTITVIAENQLPVEVKQDVKQVQDQPPKQSQKQL